MNLVNTYHGSTPYEVITAIIDDLAAYNLENPAVMDIGAGSGQVLQRLAQPSKRYAIEKNFQLRELMGSDSFLIATDFNTTTLIDKLVDVVYSKPPSQLWEAWATKIITEANASLVYLVLPDSWQQSEAIQRSLSARRAKHEIITSFTLNNHPLSVVRVKLGVIRKNRSMTDTIAQSVKPFDAWFDAEFPLGLPESAASDYSLRASYATTATEIAKSAKQEGKDVIVALADSYDSQMNTLLQAYKTLLTVDKRVLCALNVNVSGVKTQLENNINGIKDGYWKALFEYFDVINKRLCTSHRKKLKTYLNSHTSIEYGQSMAHEVILWAIKHANDNQATQLTDLVTKLVEETSVAPYKSNVRTFKREQWRYLATKENTMKFKLELQFVVDSYCGMQTDSTLYKNGYNLLNDLLIVAYSVGFDTSNTPRAEAMVWASRKKNTFYYYDHNEKKELPLMEVSAFKKGTLHLKFNQLFMCKLNVEMGRLKGWLKSPQDAATELEIDQETARDCFQSITYLGRSSVPLLANHQ